MALITGASSGIGAGISRALAAEGASVYINYPNPSEEERAAEVQRAIEAAGGKADIVMADVSDETQVLRMFDDIRSKSGTVHILINNAGIQRDAPLTEMSLKQWNEVIGTNLTGQFLCAREAIREFLRRGVEPGKKFAGNLICISSVHQEIPWALHANYAASKGGVMQLMKSLAQEFAPHQIRVNSICPGAIRTNINKDAWIDPRKEERLIELIPYGRIGTVSDIGKAAVWLASSDSDYVNGASLFVDGGMTLYPGFSTNG